MTKTKQKLLVAMKGKASAAKAAEGDAPVFAYIASLPQPQRRIAEAIDALALVHADRAKDLSQSTRGSSAGPHAPVRCQRARERLFLFPPLRARGHV